MSNITSVGIDKNSLEKWRRENPETKLLDKFQPQKDALNALR